MTPSVLGRRYAPLIVLAAVQVLLVAIAPSSPLNLRGGYGSSYGNGAGTNGAQAAGGGPNGASGAGGLAGGNGALAGGAGGNAAGAGGGAGGPGGGAGSGQLFNCGPNGLTIGVTHDMPPCTRVVAQSQNGGSTMPGVTSSQIHFIIYRPQGNAQVNAILNEENLAANNEQNCEAFEAFTKEVNKRYNLYGRQLVSMDGPGNHAGSGMQSPCHFPYFQSQCSLTPPDDPCERAEADLIASMHPAYVIMNPPDSAELQELAKNQVPVSGGFIEPAPDSYHSNFAPFWWDWNSSGTWNAQDVAEYWCKKLANRPVQYAGDGPGDVMHGFSATGPPPIRRVGIVYPSTNGDPTTADSANKFLSLVNGGMCGSNPPAKGYAYQSDITTAQQQSNTTVAALKSDHITSVIMFGDPIAPVFLTNTEDHNGYHPEQLLAGVGVIDYDVLGQLYNQNAWRYAFGVSVLMNPAPFSQSDAVKAWQDVGNSGEPDGTENAYWAYWALLGSTFQLAGPGVNPGTMRQGLFSAPAAGGTPDNPLIKYGQSIGAYTGLHDARQTFWCPNQNSPINGRPGTYVSVDGGRRFQLGQWTGDLNGVFPGGPCAA